jgi:hypothetical protein
MTYFPPELSGPEKEAGEMQYDMDKKYLPPLTLLHTPLLTHE